MNKNFSLEKAFNITIYSYIIIVMLNIILAAVKSETLNNSGSVLFGLMSFFGFIYLFIIKVRMSGKYKELYEKAYCRIILFYILISLILDIILIFKNLGLNYYIIFSLLISCIAYKLMNRNNREENKNTDNKVIVIDTKSDETGITKKAFFESVKISIIFAVLSYIPFLFIFSIIALIYSL